MQNPKVLVCASVVGALFARGFGYMSSRTLGNTFGGHSSLGDSILQAHREQRELYRGN